MRAALREFFEVLTAMSVLVVVGVTAANTATPSQTPPERREEPAPVRIAPRDTPAIGHDPLPKEGIADEPARVQKPEPPPEPKPLPPYQRFRSESPPRCTLTRYAVMQYWRNDLARARRLSQRVGDAKCRELFGAAYEPLIAAVQQGANGYNNVPDPPESYVKVITHRHECNTCPNGTPTHDCVTPNPDEFKP